MDRNYSVYIPAVPGSMREEWEQCLDQMVKNRRFGHIPLKLNIFVDQPDYSSYITAKKYLSETLLDAFRGACPAFSITIHPPETNRKIGVEELSVTGDSEEIICKFWKSVPYVVVKSGKHKEVWGAGLGNDLFEKSTRKAADAAFDSVVGILSQEKMTLNNVVRQWNYIGDILKMNDGFQNYQIFNEVRSEYYKKYRTIQGYPAATGIGMKYGGVFLDFCALEADDTLRIKPVKNPNQSNAYEYGQQVLKGSILNGKTAKHPPQFERALLIVNSTYKYLFISGTASIIGQETIGKGDVREQTLVTIENINKLTQSDHLGELPGDQDFVRGKYTLLRVYVKNQEHFDEVRKICSDHFPHVPAIFIEADICREDLLMEIEAEFII